jgi:prolipoprotein diacylglyceryltransferase
MGQILSAPMIIVGGVMIAMAYGRKNKEATA